MRGMIVGVAASVLLSGLAQAEPLSCKAFREALVHNIEKGGDLVAHPDFIAAYQGGNPPHTRYDYHNIVGLSGNLDCYDTGKLRSFDLFARIDSADDAENLYRVSRYTTLSSAALCSVEPLKNEQCRTKIETLVERLLSKLKKDRVRGESDLHVSEEKNPSAQTEMEVSLAPGFMTFEFNTNLNRRPDEYDPDPE